MQIRQGDVLLVACRPPVGATLVSGDGLRVEGERTGHAHVLPGRVYTMPNGERLIELEVETSISHEEHHAIPVPPGWWRVVLQREYTPVPQPSRGRWSPRWRVD